MTSYQSTSSYNQFPLLLCCLMGLLWLGLGLACGSSGGSGAWQPASHTAPGFDLAAQPALFIRVLDNWQPLIMVDLATSTETRLPRELVYDPTLLLANEYQVVGNTLTNVQGQLLAADDALRSPNGLWLAEQRQGSLLLRRADHAGMLTLSTHGGPFFPTWSPDGQWLAYGDSQGVWLVSLADLTVRPLTPNRYHPLAWSQDNRQLLLRYEDKLIIFNLETQAERVIAGVDGGQLLGMPVWSPDGRVIYTRYGNQGQLTIQAAANQPDEVMARLIAIQTDGSRNPLRYLLPGSQDQGIAAFLLSPDGTIIVARHFICGLRPSGLIPFIRTRQCTGSLIAVEASTGHYVTLPLSYLSGEMAWARPQPAANLAALPIPPEAVTFATPPPATPPATIPPPSAPTSTPLPDGFDRSRPFAFGTTATTTKWEFTVLEMLRDAAAMEYILANNPLTPPPDPGQTYVLVSVIITPTATQESQTLNHFHFGLTGAQNILYRQAALTLSGGPPQLNQEIAAGQSLTLWLPFQIAAGETDLLLTLVDDPLGQPAFLALEPGVAINHPPGLPMANEIGLTPDAAANPGEWAITQEWGITVLEALRDEAAWERILAANQFNKPPAEGSHYWLVRVGFQYVGTAPGPHRVFDSHFRAADSGGRLLPQVIIVTPEPTVAAALFPGGRHEGWVVLTAPLRAEPLLHFKVGNGEARYLRLVNSGQ